MCGICGLVAPEWRDKRRLVAQMNERLSHRGPDGSGQFSDDDCSIAMRRLAIIDVQGGDQPIFNEDEQVVIVFNGEIYNFRELKVALQKRGHRFRTNSDTETILHLFEDEREDTPKYLKGMFALCLYDRREKSLYLARDRFGEKPLFYFYHPSYGLAFSSEVRSLLACSFVPRRLDYEALGYYLRVGLVPAPLTMFEGVKVLPPGHWLRFRDGRLEVQPYYAIDYTEDRSLQSEAVAIEALREMLATVVKRQSVSEVPLGAFLSGGIDSSSVVAMLQAGSNQAVKSLTVRFEEALYDESSVARETAAHLSTDHNELVVPNTAFQSDDLWRIVEHVGVPFPDSSAIPTYLLCKSARQVVTVAISGDGGDELFAGYPYFRWGMSIQRLQKVPPTLRRSSASFVKWLVQETPALHTGRLRRVRRAIDVSLLPETVLPVALGSLFEPGTLSVLVRDKVVLAVAKGELPLLTTFPDGAERWSTLRRLMYYRLKHVLPSRMLTKVDSMSMASSLEVRAPMLDVDLAELSMRLPDKHLIHKGCGKYILRRAMREALPEVVFQHPKSGFSIPLHLFQNSTYLKMAQELVLGDSDILQLFHPETLHNIVQTGISRQDDRADTSVYRSSHQLWAMMQLVAWVERFKVAI